MNFRGEYSFLSNFANCRLQVYNIICSSTEVAFQLSKTLIPEEIAQFVNLAPGEVFDIKDNTRTYESVDAKKAKYLSHRITTRPDWHRVNKEIMYNILCIKFKHNDFFKRKLLATNSIEIIEHNKWNDEFWGVNEFTQKGENNLGKIIMRIRDEIRNNI